MIDKCKCSSCKCGLKITPLEQIIIDKYLIYFKMLEVDSIFELDDV